MNPGVVPVDSVGGSAEVLGLGRQVLGLRLQAPGFQLQSVEIAQDGLPRRIHNRFRASGFVGIALWMLKCKTPPVSTTIQNPAPT